MLFGLYLFKIKTEEYVLLDGMINNLNQAALKMGNLAENVNMFTAWWVEMETALGKAMGDVRGLKPGKDTLRVKGIQNKWTNIRDDYRRYKVQVSLYIKPCSSITQFIDH